MNYDEIAKRCKLLEKFEDNTTNQVKEPITNTSQIIEKPNFLGTLFGKYILWPLLAIVIIAIVVVIVLYFVIFKKEKEEDQNSESNIETQQANQTRDQLFDVEEMDFDSEETSSETFESIIPNPLYSIPMSQSETDPKSQW